MRSTGRYSEHEEAEIIPEKPFIKDLKKDLENIDKYYTQKEGNGIKKKVIEEILKEIK